MAGAAITSPLFDTLQQLHRRFAPHSGGEVATYIPELAGANPDHFAICVATSDGRLYTVGDAGAPFTIQSISKPFLYGLALEDCGAERVLSRIGVEPSGEAFNAISLEPESGRPRNPMINAGAIATSGLVSGEDSDEKLRRARETMSEFAGRELEIDDAVYRSEASTGHRNRAIPYLLRNAGILGDDVDEVVDRYFRQCSVLVNCADLAIMAATLANGGENPITGHRVISHEHVARVLSVMATCGMYDYAGSWVYHVGMPAKSGVSGGIIAVLPGQLGVGVYSPPLDGFGNSVRGVAVCEALSSEFGLHLLRPPVSPHSAVMTTYPLSDVSSKRRRSEQEMRCLIDRGDAVRILRLQGQLVFSTAEVVLRRALDEHHPGGAVVFDCHRVHSIDTAASRLMGLFVSKLLADDGVVVFAGLREGDGRIVIDPVPDTGAVRFFPAIDDALEWCEDRILSEAGFVVSTEEELSLDRHPMLSGLDAARREELAAIAIREVHAEGQRIISYGEAADCVYLLVSGNVSVNVDLADSGRYRLATIGAGAVFGELALMDGEPRTANVDAETEVTCYAIRVTELERETQALLVAYLARHLAARLRRADREIIALAS